MNNFVELAKIDVSKHIEKKGNLSYLSWAWAVDQLMRKDPNANWVFHDPVTFPDGTMLVSCTVTAFCKSMTMHLPVMDHRNKAISNPNAFDINKNMMRCLVKTIACHGLGLYIYAGEDLPEEAKASKHEDEYLAYETEHLEPMKKAAAAGLKALQEAFQDVPMSEYKKEFWKRNGDVLKGIANESS